MTKLVDSSSNSIFECANGIKNGQIAIIPTETVYGICANAFDKEAVNKVFEIKKRSKTKPLITLVSDREMLNKIVCNITPIQEKLMEAFWPGPLTIIFDSNETLPSMVTAGQNQIGVRIPGNNTTLSVIKKAGVPIVAPSANISGKISITNAKVAYQEFNGKVDYVLDAGISDIGIESTIVKVENEVVNILRCGSITLEDIEKISLKSKIIKSDSNKHYSIDKPAILVTGKYDDYLPKITKFIFDNRGKKIGVIGFSEHYKKVENVDNFIIMGTYKNDEEIAKNLFNSLNVAKKTNVDIFLIECPKVCTKNSAVIDKLNSICNGKII